VTGSGAGAPELSKSIALLYMLRSVVDVVDAYIGSNEASLDCLVLLLADDWPRPYLAGVNRLSGPSGSLGSTLSYQSQALSYHFTQNHEVDRIACPPFNRYIHDNSSAKSFFPIVEKFTMSAATPTPVPIEVFDTQLKSKFVGTYFESSVGMS
jgi:hypothetical protein